MLKLVEQLFAHGHSCEHILGEMFHGAPRDACRDRCLSICASAISVWGSQKVIAMAR